LSKLLESGQLVAKVFNGSLPFNLCSEAGILPVCR
jgi:hypothetical protein